MPSSRGSSQPSSWTCVCCIACTGRWFLYHQCHLGNPTPLCLLPSEREGFPGGSDGKEPACNAGDPGSIPGLGISSGEGNGNPFLYSCLENPTDRGAWWATVHGVVENRVTGITFGGRICGFICLCMGTAAPFFLFPLVAGFSSFQVTQAGYGSLLFVFQKVVLWLKSVVSLLPAACVLFSEHAPCLPELSPPHMADVQGGSRGTGGGAGLARFLGVPTGLGRFLRMVSQRVLGGLPDDRSQQEPCPFPASSPISPTP